MSYNHVKIERIEEHSEDIRSFVFNPVFNNSKPGQFVMVWLPGIDEKPFSLSDKGRITVRRIGEFTEELFKKNDGYLDIRGPYGNCFPNDVRDNVAIGGGCGVAPLMSLMNVPFVSDFVLAGKTEDELIFLNDIERKLGENIVCVTEDGSCGLEGVVTDVKIPRTENNYYVCGPEKMMKAIGEKLVKEGVEEDKIYLMIERYMKCAVGLCGNCSFDGYRVCVDGPVFRYDVVRDLSHFGELRRNRTGKLVEI